MATAAAAQSTDTPSVVVTIGNKTPLHFRCFEHARDGDASQQAVEACSQSLENEPLTPRKRAINHANRGVVYFNIGDYESAIGDFTQALALNINDRAKLYANRGLTYETLRYDALARADYQAALAINPDHELAAHRLDELSKPLYERSRLPKRITAEAPVHSETGS